MNVRAKLEPLFDGPHLSGDARDSLLSTLEDVPPAELRDQLRRTVQVLDGYATAAETQDLATLCLLSEAQARAQEMLARLEA